MELNYTIDNLLLGKDLHKKSAFLFFDGILTKNREKNIETALALLHKKTETAEELVALVEYARKRTKRPSIEKNKNFKHLHHRLTDGCGTGGDGKHTFNISTIACLVAASAGAYIAKHGNRSITSRCGSSDLVESLGIKLDQTPRQMLRSIQTTHFIQAFQNISQVRKNLSQNKIKTIFNLAGPLLNPARVQRQVIGVFHRRYLKVMASALKQLGTQRALVFIGRDGTDELTTHSPNLVVELRAGKIRQYSLDGLSLGLRKSKAADLDGGGPLLNRKIALRILQGKDKSTRRDVICLNAAAILYVSEVAKSLKEGVRLSRIALDSGRTYNTLLKLRQISNDSR